MKWVKTLSHYLQFKMLSSGNQASNGTNLIYRLKPIYLQPKENTEIHTTPITTKCLFWKSLFTMKSSLRYLMVLILLAFVGYKVASLKECAINDPLCSTNYLKYAIIFDAGSTGSRIHIFTFKNNSALGLNGDEMVLQDELFREVKPGLSSYSENPSWAAYSLIPLLEYALKMIPQEEWSETPIMLKATAGLRLLSDAKADSILREVEQLFLQYPFQVRRGYVSMMSGEDEGICGWLTINFLLGVLTNKENSVATLDLGGGSTQISFIPSCPETRTSAPKGFVAPRTYFHTSTNLYTHSYLGLGLMASRYSILSSSSDNSVFPNGTIILKSPCIHEGIRESWTYGTQNFLVTSTGKVDLEKCQSYITEYIQSFNVHKPCDLKTKPIYAISYYYDRAEDMGIIGSEPMNTINLKTYRAAATKACQVSRPEFPFLCFDATYIMTLLTEGLGIEETKDIVVSKNIDGVETSWGLGAGFQAVYKNL